MKDVECLFVRRGMTGGMTIFYIAFSSAATYMEHAIPSPRTPDKPNVSLLFRNFYQWENTLHRFLGFSLELSLGKINFSVYKDTSRGAVCQLALMAQLLRKTTSPKESVLKIQLHPSLKVWVWWHKIWANPSQRDDLFPTWFTSATCCWWFYLNFNTSRLAIAFLALLSSCKCINNSI